MKCRDLEEKGVFVETKLERDGEIYVVSVKGHIHYNSADPFRESVLKSLQNKKVIFNLCDLSFVGSSGITPFVDTIVDLARENCPNVKLCGVGTEFRRVIESKQESTIEILEDIPQAKIAFLRTNEIFQSEMPEFISSRFESSSEQPAAEVIKAEDPNIGIQIATTDEGTVQILPKKEIEIE